ncbi:MAG: FIST C-terminal domain-containing protein [Myxococcales bacterium]|nr:FIST C-terminal domain-containing protein [Myxococcales bacterium]
MGGGAGQPFGPQHQTYQYEDTRAHRDAAVVLVLEGDVELVLELTNGTEPLGLELTVTAAHDHVITHLDDRPALEVLDEMVGVTRTIDHNQTADWALGVHPDDGAAYEGPITRAIFGMDVEAKALVLQAPIATGATVQVCHRTREAVHDRAVAMAKRLREQLTRRDPFLLLSFECGARPRPFLGDEAARQEVVAIQHTVGPWLPWLGFYAWGELAPVGSRTHLHNYTFPLVALCRARAETPSP